MKMQFKKFCLLIIFIFIINNIYAQTDMLFWFVAPEVNDEHGAPGPNIGQPTYLRFSNAEDFEVTVTITQPANSSFNPITVVIPANQTRSVEFHRTTFDNITSFDLDNIENYLNPFEYIGIGREGNVGNKGLKIEASGRVTAYYEVKAKWNYEIMSLKGRNALGTEFFVPFQTAYPTTTSYFTVYSAIDLVATVPNTTITITAKIPMLIIDNNTSPYTAWPANTPYTTTLINAGETFCAVPYGVGNNAAWPIDRTKELAGAHVVASDPIAVNTKDDMLSGPGVDLAADQLVPVSILGQDYIVMQNKFLTTKPEYAYAVAVQPGTRIYVNGVLFQTLVNAGDQSNPIQINSNKLITSPDNPFYVFHVTGVNYWSGGTPGIQQAGAIIPTISTCTGSYSVSFVRSIGEPFFMNIMVRDGGQDGFLLNGAPLNPAIFTESFVTGTPSGTWWVANYNASALINVNDVNVLENTKDKLFHLGIINGENECFYGYFSDFNSIKVVGNVGTTINTWHKACYGERVELVAYGANSYFWYADKEPSFLTTPTVQRPIIYPTETRNYTVVGSGDCNMKDSVDILVKVAPPINADFIMEDPGWPPCSPLDIELVDFSEGVDDNYKWWFGDGAGDTLIVGTDPIPDTIPHRYENNSDTIQVRKITLITENNFWCKDTLETEVIIYPAVHADFDPDVLIDCNPLDVNFTDLSTGNTDKYRWVFGDGSISNTVGNESHRYSHTNILDTVEYNVELQLTSPFLCRDTMRHTIRVFPYIEGEFTVDTAYGCSPFIVTFTNVSMGANTITLDYGDGTPPLNSVFGTQSHTYINNGPDVDTNFVILTATNTEGCVKIWRDTIIVYPKVTANYTVDAPAPGPYIGCNNRTFNFTNASTNANTYLWTFGDGSNTTSASYAKTYNNTTTSDQTYTFNLHAESQYGCYDDTTNQVRINRAYADFTVNTDKGCSPLPVTVTNNSIGTGITTWNWSFGDGVTDNNQIPAVNPHIYTNTTVPIRNRYLRLTVTGTNGCTHYKQDTISVYSSIDISMTPVNPSGCDSLQVNFNRTINHGVPAKYTWDFGDGTSSTLSNPVKIYRNLTNPNVVTYNAKLTVETANGCKDSDQTNVTVHPYIRSYFSLDESSGCSPDTIWVKPTSYIGIDQYRWDFNGDLVTDRTRTSATQESYIYPRNLNTSNINNIYNIRLTVFNGNEACNKVFTRRDTVHAEAKANFNNMGAIDCNEHTVSFTNLSTNASINKWDFGDGSTSSVKNPVHTFTNTDPSGTATYNVKLDVTTSNGCTHDTAANIYVRPYVKADFDINVSEGCSPLNVTITNNSQGTQFFWFWDDDDLTLAHANSTLQNPGWHQYTHTSGGIRTDSLTLIVGNGEGCYDTLKRAIKIRSSIVADFSYNQPDTCNPSPVNFDASTTNPAASEYYWDFGDGSFLTTGIPAVNGKIYTNNTKDDKDYLVTLSVETPEGCIDTHQETVHVYSRVEADFSIDVNAGCPTFTTLIENTSFGNATDNYRWYVDGTYVTGSPTNKDAFTGYDFTNTDPVIRKYVVGLEARNNDGCLSYHEDTIYVYERIIADFAMDKENGCPTLNIGFTNNSQVTPDTKYLWNFGDGATSSAFEPTNGHDFYNSRREEDRPYTIKLKLTSENYCTHEFSDDILVYNQPLAKFFIDKTSSCPPLVSLMESQSLGEDMFAWRFGDGTTDNITDQSLTHQYESTGAGVVDSYDLELWVGTNEGCMDSTSLTVNVFPSVTADFSFAYLDDYCSPSEIEFTDNSSAWVENYYWRFDDGNTSNLKDPTNRYEITTDNDMVYHVFLRVASQYNCWDTITKPVPVYVQPYSSFDISPVVQKFPESSVSITNKSNYGPFNYLWEYGDMDLTTSTQRNASPNPFVYGHWGIKDIRLTITSQTSTCADTSMKTATILPPDVNAAFSTNIDGGCLDDGLEVQFTAAQSNYNEEYDYSWDFGDGSDIATGQYVTHTYTQPGTFYVKMIARSQQEGGGEDFEYKTIRIYTNPIANFEVLPSVSMIDNKTLEARVEFYNLSQCNDTSGCSYLWEFGDGSTAISRDVTHGYTELGKYDVRLTVTNSAGCIDTLTKPQEVEIIGAGEIEFPNAFTPNGDGLNDVFRPVSQGVIKYELFIYNRWGELIFTTKDLAAGWNGTVKGEPAKPDVYVWKAIGNFTNGRGFEIAGDVTLIR